MIARSKKYRFDFFILSKFWKVLHWSVCFIRTKVRIPYSSLAPLSAIRMAIYHLGCNENKEGNHDEMVEGLRNHRKNMVLKAFPFLP